MPAPKLTGKQRRFLRALGHHLEPVVRIGKEGVTASIGAALDRALADHELVKVRLLESCPEGRDAAAATLGRDVRAAVVGGIGRTLLFYRPHPEKPRIVLPSASPAKDQAS